MPIFRFVGDTSSTVELEVDAATYEEAFEIADKTPSEQWDSSGETVYITYCTNQTTNEHGDVCDGGEWFPEGKEDS